MADVQLEHGYVRISNSLYRAINLASFSDMQRRIVHALIGLTYGWNRKTVEIRETALAEFAGVANLRGRASGGFRSALRELIVAHVVEELRAGDRAKPPVFMVVKNHEQWSEPFKIHDSRLAHVWGNRPASADHLVPKQPPSGGGGDRSESGDGDDQVASDEATFVSGDVASAEAANQLASTEAIIDVASTQATAASDVASPKASCGLGEGHNSAVSPDSVRLTRVERHERQNYNNDDNSTRVHASGMASNQATSEPFDPSSLELWPTAYVLLVSDHNRRNVVDFLARCPDDQRLRLCGRIAAWLQGLDCPPSYQPTPDVLASALAEYEGTFAYRHVWAFVEDCVRRWKRASGDVGRALIPAGSGEPASLRQAAIVDRRTAQAEAQRIVADIRALIETRQPPGQAPRRIIPLAGVEAMGERVARAYRDVGGADRFLAAAGETIAFLVRDFEIALSSQAGRIPATA